MTATQHIITVPYADNELSHVSYNACITHDPKQAFEAGFAIANYLHKKTIAAVQKINAAPATNADNPTPQQDTPPTAPQPAAAVQPAALPAPAAAPALEADPENYFNLA